jgi:DNA polymerase III epsilon subunit-like protein
MTKQALIFDTETSGLFPRYKTFQDILHMDKTLWPYLIQLSFMVTSQYGRTVKEGNTYVELPEGVSVPQEATNINGITNAKLNEQGVSLYKALQSFYEAYKNADIIIGHNVDFDMYMIRISVIRLRNQLKEQGCVKFPEFITQMTFEDKKIFDTMKQGRNICKIPIKDKFGNEFMKSPKLKELHATLFPGDQLDEHQLHNSMYDVSITNKCYQKMRTI